MSSQFHSSNSAAPRNGAFEPTVKNQQRTNDLLISVYDAEDSEEFESKYFNVLPHSSKSQVCTSYRNRFQPEGGSRGDHAEEQGIIIVTYDDDTYLDVCGEAPSFLC